MLFNEVYIKMLYKYKKRKKVYRRLKTLYGFNESPLF